MNKHKKGKKKQLKKFVMTKEQKDAIGCRDEIEIWTHLIFKGVETNYLISTLGNIKRIKIREKRHPKYVTKYINRDGYLQVQLVINGKTYLPTVHRLVALTFIKIPDKYIKINMSFDDLEVNHKNGLKYDPYCGNLEWITPSENTNHAYCHKLRKAKFGDNHPNSILNEKLVHEICKELKSGMRNIDVANKFNVSSTLVNQIRNKSIWKHVSDLYNINIKRRETYNYLTERSVKQICEMIVEGKTNREISDRMNTQMYIIRNIRNKKRWVNISNKYNF